MSGVILDQDGRQVEARQQVAVQGQQAMAAVENPYTAPLASFMNMLADPKISAEDMNARLAVMERMMALEKVFEDRQIEREKRDAEKAFHRDLAMAKGEIPPIKRTKNVKFPSKDRDKQGTNYWHEDFGEINKICVPILAKYGLHYDFLVEQGIPNQPVSVQCVIHHSLGHSVSGKTAYGPRDDSGNKNIMQQSESTVTYLKRSTVKAALGLAAGDIDDDGRGATEQAAKDEPKITAAQVETIEKLIAALPNSHVTRDTDLLLGKLKTEKGIFAETLEEIPASAYEDCLGRLAHAKATRDAFIAAAKAQSEDDANKIRDSALQAARTTTPGGLGRIA